MLTARFKNEYTNKIGEKKFVYVVNGTKSEVEDYRISQATAANKTPDQWARLDDKDPNSAPLYFVNVTKMIKRGELPKKQYNLIKGYNETYFHESDTMEILEEMRASMISEGGKILGTRLLGAQERATVNTNTPAAAPAGGNKPADTKPQTAVEALIEGAAVATGEGAGLIETE